MNVDPNLTSIEETDAKRRTVILALIAVIIVGTCALFALVFVWFQPNQNTLFAKYFPSPTPTRVPQPSPTPDFEPITIIAHEDYSIDYPYLENLAPDWEHSPMLPSTVTSHVELNWDQPVVVSRGWCTTTEEILDENLTHIEWLVEADGGPIDVGTLNPSKFVDTTTACKGYDGLVEQWSAGEHTVILTMRVDQDINDGSIDFKAGDYVEVFIVNVTR